MLSRSVGAAIAAAFGLAMLAVALPGTASAQTDPQPQAVSVCPLPPESVGSSLDVCVDRGDGSTYHLGDPITICVTANIPQIAIFPPPPAPTIRLTSSVNGGPGVVILQEQFASGQRCLSRTIVPPTGQETILAQAIGQDGRAFASDVASYHSTGGASQVSATVSVDRGPNSIYFAGNPIMICATVSPVNDFTLYPARLVSLVNGTVTRTIELGPIASTQCIGGVISPPLGQETIRLEVRDPRTGVVVAISEVNYTSYPGF